jgi:mannose-1-phosphate guanylyltransferase
MASRGNLWSVVLAAGEGTRLRSLTSDERGLSIPKQYCSFRSPHSLLRQSISRCRRLVPHERTLVVVAADHRHWWRHDLADLQPGNVIVQPCNRGTACGVLLPLVALLGRDPDAIVAYMPSDHHVEQEWLLAEAMRRAAELVRDAGERMVLLGLEPESADPGYGWITPSRPLGPGLFEVLSFVEKPERERAEQLIRGGALWNSFIFVARAAALMDLFEWTMPWLTRLFTHVEAVGGVRRRDARYGLYDHLPTLDFSRDVLQGLEDELRVLVVPPCGWVDLGTPERVAATVKRQEECPIPTGGREQREPAPRLDLAAAARAVPRPERPTAK